MANIRFEAMKMAFSHEIVAGKQSATEGMRVKDYFAQDVVTREKMKEYIAQDVLDQLFDDVDNGRTIRRDIAGMVAIGIRKWAIEHGATIIRTHDVKETKQTIELCNSLLLTSDSKM